MPTTSHLFKCVASMHLTQGKTSSFSRSFQPSQLMHQYYLETLTLFHEWLITLHQLNWTQWPYYALMHCLPPASPTPHLSSHPFIHRNGHYTVCLDRCYARQSLHISTSFSLFHRFPSSHHGILDHIPTMVHLFSPEPIPKGSPFWRLNATKIDSHYVNTLTHALVSLAHLDSLSILDRWGSSPVCF